MEQTSLLIVGGGPAGLSAALVAGRARLQTVLVDAGEPRNAVTGASHGFLTRDGVHPLELQAIGRAQLEPYRSVTLHRGRVVDAELRPGGVLVRADDGTEWLAERVIFATGQRTRLDLVGIPGIEEVYGRSVFPCPFCDGFEHADLPLAVFAPDAHLATMVRMWSDDVVLFTNGGPVDDAEHRELHERGIRVERSPIVALTHDQGQLLSVALESGAIVERRAGFLGEEHWAPATDLPTKLGVPMGTNPMGMAHYVADPFGKTEVEGVYVIGDLAQVFASVIGAASQGHACAAGIVRELAFG